MASASSCEIYRQIHETQREQLFAVSLRIGTTNFSDREDVLALEAYIRELLARIDAHADRENKVIRPLLESRLPGSSQPLKRDHRRIADSIRNVERVLDRLAVANPDPSDSLHSGFQLYRELNRFIAQYLVHMDEEDKTEPLLRQLYPEKTFRNVADQLSSTDWAPHGRDFRKLLIDLDVDQLSTIFSGARLNSEPRVFESMCRLARKSLPQEKWLRLKAKLG